MVSRSSIGVEYRETWKGFNGTNFGGAPGGHVFRGFRPRAASVVNAGTRQQPEPEVAISPQTMEKLYVGVMLHM